MPIDGTTKAVAITGKDLSTDQSNSLFVSAFPTKANAGGANELEFEYWVVGTEYPVLERTYYDFFK